MQRSRQSQSPDRQFASAPLRRPFPSSPFLQLELRANLCLDATGAARLAPLLHPHYRAQLRSLDLGGCPLGDAGFAELLLNIAQNKQLQVG